MGLITPLIKFLRGEKDSEDEPYGAKKTRYSEFLSAVSEVESTIVREVMTPRTDMVYLDISSPPDELKNTILKCKHSNIPVYNRRIEEILGVLDLRDVPKLLINEINISYENLRSILKEPYIVPDTKKITELLEELIKKQIELALVVDEYGGVSGIVTQKDLCIEMVKNIGFVADDVLLFDESGLVSVCANTDIDKVEELFDVDIPHKDFDTIGGFLFHLSGRIPAEGESFKYKNLLFKVAKAEENKLEKICIEKIKK